VPGSAWNWKNVQTVVPEIVPALAASLTATRTRLAAVVVQVAFVQGTSMFANLAAGAGAGPESPRGGDNFDPTATEGYFVGPDNATFSTSR
jgi:hypothetical protein